jgi:hypothetical protein
MGAGPNSGIVEIRDITGRLFASENLSLDNSGMITINLLQNAPKGLYFAKVNLNGSQFVQKVVKE